MGIPITQFIANWGNFVFVLGKNVREYGNLHEFTPNTRSSSGAHTFANKTSTIGIRMSRAK